MNQSNVLPQIVYFPTIEMARHHVIEENEVRVKGKGIIDYYNNIFLFNIH